MKRFTICLATLVAFLFTMVEAQAQSVGGAIPAGWARHPAKKAPPKKDAPKDKSSGKDKDKKDGNKKDDKKTTPPCTGGSNADRNDNTKAPSSNPPTPQDWDGLLDAVKKITSPGPRTGNNSGRYQETRPLPKP